MATLWPIVIVALALAALSDAVSLRDKDTMAYVKKDWKIYAVMALAMAVFVGLRTRGNDTYVYRQMYERLGTNWSAIGSIDWLKISGAPGLQCYGIILKTLGASTQDYLMLTALITIGIYLWFIRKYTCNIFLSIFYFITMGAYTFTMAAIKQTMAVAFLLLATDRAIQKKWVQYLLWVMFAELFHPYAFIYLVVPFVTFRPWSKGTIYLLTGAVVVALFMSQFMSAIDSVTGALGYSYDENEFAGEGVNIFRLFVVWVPLVLSFLGRDLLRRSDDRAANTIINLMMVNAVIMFIGLFGTANYFARLANYFLIFQVIALPRVLNLFSENDRKKITALSIVGFSAYYYYGEGIVHGGFDNNYSIMSLWDYISSYLEGETMVRVLQVVTHMNRGGLETMLMNFYRSIDREQVQFDFLTHRPYDGDYGAEIQQMGGKLYHLPTLNPFRASYKKALSQFFSEHPEYQIVHVHQDCLSSVILKVAKQQGIPIRVAHSHSSSQDKNLKYPIKLYYRNKISRYATDLFACSQDAGTWMFRGAPFHIVNNAIDTKKYDYSPEIRNAIRMDLGISENQLVLGHIGRFCSVKNHTFLLDIFTALIEQGTDATLLLVGDGELRTQMEEKAARLGLSNQIIFTGIRSDIPDLLQAMDVFVFPSLYEGLPVTLVEAQTSGLPCLISDVIPADASILPDLITKQSLSDPAKQWAQTLQTLATQSGGRRSRCKEMKEKGFDVQATANRLEEFYLEKAGK